MIYEHLVLARAEVEPGISRSIDHSFAKYYSLLFIVLSFLSILWVCHKRRRGERKYVLGDAFRTFSWCASSKQAKIRETVLPSLLVEAHALDERHAFAQRSQIRDMPRSKTRRLFLEHLTSPVDACM